MTSRKLGELMWNPGLFWLFPVWLFHPNTSIKEGWAVVVLHGAWAGIQIVVFVLLIYALRR